MKKIFVCIFIMILFLKPEFALADNGDKALIIVTDNISFKDIETFELDNYSLGLLNLKTRNPNNEESFLSSVNVGRKVNRKILESKDIKVNYLGDIFKDRIAYIGKENSNLKYLVMDKNFQGINIDVDINQQELNRAFEKNDILAIEINLDENNGVNKINEILKDNSDKKIYILPRSLSKLDSNPISKQLVPLIINKGDGVLTSDGTKRLGLVGIEDISVDIKENFMIEKTSLDIGKSIISIKKDNGLAFVENLYKQTKNLLLISYILHGLIYFAQVAMCLSLYLNRYKKQALIVYIIATNNILLSMLLGMTLYINNIYFYFAILIFMSIPLTKACIRNIDAYKILLPFSYLIICLGIFINQNIIYNSFVGFNNLMYGVRFYGFNNAMAGVFLVLSIFTMDIINKIKNYKVFKILGIVSINIINMIVLSSRFGANTGGFITGVLLFALSIYMYILPKKINYRTILYLVLLGVLILSINLYIDSLDNTQGHALEFFYRIKENGLWEFIYIVKFKLTELIRFTLMPPFSLVIGAELLISKKLYRDSDKLFKLIFTTSILGFLINDTGNVLFIYMLHYGILGLIINLMKNRQEIEI